ncbi:MAG: carboxypeptidase M32 [Myxococcaceae bacterium]
MTSPFPAFRARWRELKDLAGLVGLASWDQETYMPPQAASARAGQMATLQGLYHERLVDPVLGQLLERAREAAQTDDEKAEVRVATLERDRAVRVPADLVRALADAQSRGVEQWKAAREAKRFDVFAPSLQKLLKLRREQADALGHEGNRYDALLEAYEPGLRSDRLMKTLAALREALVPRVQKWATPAPTLLDGRKFPKDAQWRFTLRLLKDMGFDFEAGRQDLSTHPFTGGTHPKDVRLTTRIDETNPFPALFGAIHEGGHGLFEQGFAEADFGTALAAAPSMGLHESQSRLWENLVGRSAPFWEHYYPLFQKECPDALAGVSLEQWLSQVNRVERTLVRVDADEVTYNLHIILRTELERALLAGDLSVEGLPGAWREAMDKLLGIRPQDDKDGVLQDIHWAWGEFGYFPTYALGNLYAAQMYAAAERDLGPLAPHLRRGDLRPLQQWLSKNVHAQGYRYPAETLVERVTGKGLDQEAFVRYLDAKFD